MDKKQTEPSHRSAHGHARGDDNSIDWKGYGRLLAMVVTSTVVMYFFMYLNIYRWEDFKLSETRFFMSTLMFGTMLAIMLAFMLHMYKNKAVNTAIFAASFLLFLIGLYFMRSQVTVEDKSWMKSMIPHHSIAIMVSERADLTDPRVKKLAKEIIAAQEKEIAEMEYLIEVLGEEGEADESFPLGEAAGPTPVGTLAEALARPAIASLDASGMTDEEVARVVPAATCSFRFSEGQQTQVALNAEGKGVMKIAGQLVPLTRVVASDGAKTIGLTAEGAQLTIRPTDDKGSANLVLNVETKRPLRVGYAGYYACAA